MKKLVFLLLLLVLFIIAFYIAIKKDKDKNKRKVIISSVFGLIYGTIMGVGHYYFTHEYKIIIKDINIYFNIITLTLIFSVLIYVILEILSNIKKHLKKLKLPNKLETLISNADKKTFLFIFIIITLLWILPFLAVYPGYFCYDRIRTNRTISQ